MAIHHMGDIKYIKGQTADGKYRSPMREISYNCGQELLDRNTGRTHNRPHTDGTIILDNNLVCADALCKYGNLTVSSKKRREEMYYELYNMNKEKDERVFATTDISFPNSFNDDQLKEAAKNIALSFSEHFRRPYDYGIHKKPATKTKNANNHMHIAWPMRIIENGKFSAKKSISYYVNMDGSINYAKKYKDENGLDVRKPRLRKDAPKDDKLKYARDAEGNYIYQARDKKGRRKWRSKEVTDLGPKDLAWMHDEIDRINTQIMEKYNLKDKIKRNDKRVTKELKDLKVEAVHIGKRDGEIQGDQYYDKLLQNETYNFYRDNLNEEYKELDRLNDKKENANTTATLAEKDYQQVRINTEYYEKLQEKTVTNTKKSANEYIAVALPANEIISRLSSKNQNEYKIITNRNHKILMKFNGVIETGAAAIIADINAIKQKNVITLKEQAKLELYEKNLKQVQILRNGLSLMITGNKNNQNEIISKETADRWNNSSAEEKASILKTIADDQDLRIFCFAHGLDFKKINTGKVTTADISTIHAINVCPVPGIRKQYKNDESVNNNLNTITESILKTWEAGLSSDLHQPPENIEMLLVLTTAPRKIVEDISGKISNMYFKPVFLDKYLPDLGKQEYEKLLQELDKKENEYNAKRKYLNENQKWYMNNYLEMIVDSKFQDIYNPRYRNYINNKGPKPIVENIRKEIRDEYIYQSGKQKGYYNNGKILKEAKALGINTMEAERITEQLRKNFATYHIIQNQQEPTCNNDKTSSVSTVKSNQQTKPTNTPKGNEETTVVIVQDFKQHNASRKLEQVIGIFEENNDGTYKNKPVSDGRTNLHMHYAEKNSHELSEIEKAEKRLYDNWHPGQQR